MVGLAKYKLKHLAGGDLWVVIPTYLAWGYCPTRRTAAIRSVNNAPNSDHDAARSGRNPRALPASPFRVSFLPTAAAPI